MSKDPEFDRKLSSALNEMSERHIEEAAKAVRLEHNGLKIFRSIALSAGAVAAAAAVTGVIISNMPQTRHGVDLVESSDPADPAALLEALPAKAAETKAAETEKTSDEEPALDDVPIAAHNIILGDYTVPENVPEELKVIDAMCITDKYIQNGYFDENSVPELLYANEEGFLVFTDGADGVYSGIFTDNSRLLSEGFRCCTRFDYKKTLSKVERLLPFNSRNITFGAGAVRDESGAVPLIYALSGEGELLCWKYDDRCDFPGDDKFVLMSSVETDNEYMSGFSNLGGALKAGCDTETADTATVGESKYSITFGEGRKLTSIRIRRATADGSNEVYAPLPDEEEFESMIDVSDWALPLYKEYTPDTGIYRRLEYESIAVPEMSPVYAAGDGVIVYYDCAAREGANIVMALKLDSGEYVVYSHLYPFMPDSINFGSEYPESELKAGDRVTKGQIIARTGSTGYVEGPAFGVRALTPDEYEYEREKNKWIDEETKRQAVLWYADMNIVQDFIFDCYFSRVYMNGTVPFSDYIDNVYLREYAELAIQYEKPRVPEGDENYTRMTSFCNPARTVVGDTHYISLTMTVDYATYVGYGYASRPENSFEYKCVVALRDGKVVDFSIGNMGGANIAWIYGTRLNPDAFDMTRNPNPWEDEEKAKAILDYYKNAVPMQTVVDTDWNSLSGEEIWALLSKYSGVDVGSGLYIMSYLVNGSSSLVVTGIPDSEVDSIRLVHTSGKTLELIGEEHSADEIISFFGEPL